MATRKTTAKIAESLHIPNQPATQTRSSMATGKTVLATGTFDLLHPGHLRFLYESKKKGGPRARLIVVIARDATVQKRKGRKPTIPEQQRLEIVRALKPVNKAILGHQEIDFLGILQQVKPDIVSLGHDQNDIKRSVQKIIEKEKLPIRIVQIAHYGPRGLDSSTALRKHIIKTASKH